MTNCCIHQLVYPRYQEGIFGASFVQICEIHTYSPLRILLLYHHRVGQPLKIKHLFYCSCLLKFGYFLFNNIGMFFGRAPRQLLLRGDTWLNVQMMTNEIWIHPGSFISTPREHVNVFPEENNQFFLLMMRQLNSHLEKLPLIIINDDFF